MNIKNVIKTICMVMLFSLGTTSWAETGSNAEPTSADASTALGDAAITAKVKAKYLDDSRLKGSDISVTTANGVVSLTGSAPTSDVKDAAEALAKSVEGVMKVENDIDTPSVASKIEKKTKRAARKTERVVSDSWITTKVKSALLADSITKGFKISALRATEFGPLGATPKWATQAFG